MTDNVELQRVPPQNIEAEQMVLGAILIENEAMDKVSALLREEDFYRDTHRRIYGLMLAMRGQQDTIDLLTIMDAAKRNNVKLDSVGGASYFAYLVSVAPSAANIRQHAQIVIRKAQYRKIIHRCSDAAARSYEEITGPDDLISELFSELNNARRSEGTPIVCQAEFVQAGFDSIEQRHLAAKDGRIIGIPTGLRDLDRVTGGLQPGYYLIAARPGMGKTSLAEVIRDAAARHFYAAWQSIPDQERPIRPRDSVGFISIEMGKEPLALRAISRESLVPLSRLLAGTVHDSDWSRMSYAAGMLHPLPIYYEFESSSEIKVARKIDEMTQKYGAKIIFIDYTQLMQGEGKHGNREQEISSISRMIKHKVTQYNIPIVALAQLNRALEARVDKRPMMSDLRESGSLEQDSDVIIFIYREEIYKPCQCPRDGECLCGRRGRAELLGRKGRMIGTWDIDLRWDGKHTRFFDCASSE